MKIYGLELLRGLGITLSHFVQSYTVNLRRRFSGNGNAPVVKDLRETGIFTVQYPEEKKALPERFRVLPMLIFEGKESEQWSPQTERCTACGICAKVCPPQCIWIVQDKNEAGKPVPKASGFFIDVDVCMNCGLCAEYCPFDAIKMDHNFELSSSDREASHIFDIDRLHVSTEYYARTHPAAWADEQAKKQAEAQRKAEAAKKAAAARKAAEEKKEGSGGEG
jgi:NADH-quinone oxidoreductase subunit I